MHAHLNGSLSDATLKKLIDLRRKSNREFSEPLSNYNTFDPEKQTLSECFEKFKLAHELVDNIPAVKLATELVIDEFSRDHVVYLELRSAPRATEYMSKKEYLEAVIDTMIECQKTHPEIMVKYIPSINISYGIDEAAENFKLFCEIRKKFPEIVVGIDLSGRLYKIHFLKFSYLIFVLKYTGDPENGNFSDVKHIFEEARAAGFGIALHCAEIPKYDEILEKIEFMTSKDRIGHGTFIDGN